MSTINKIERALEGPLGKKQFGKNWLKGLPENAYRNYLCRAFYYCQIKEKYEGEATDSIKQGLRTDLQLIIKGRIEPQLPAQQRLTAYFQDHRFYIEKKSGSKTFKRYVIINAPQLKLQYFNKQEGGKPKSKSYSIRGINFERKEQNGVQFMLIQPQERPKGPLILSSEKNTNIGEVFSNITALQQRPQTSNKLQRFLRIYNFNIIKRLMIRFLEVHKYMRENVMIRKHTVQDLKILKHETHEQARNLTINMFGQAYKIWLKDDPIHPPHFISDFEIQTKEQLLQELMQLDAQGSMKDLNFGRNQNFQLDKIKYRNIVIKRGKYNRENDKEFKTILQKLPHALQGKVSFEQVVNGDVQPQSQSLQFMLQTLPYGQISSIAVNSLEGKNIIQVFGRSFTPKNSKVKSSMLDPSDYGHYHCLLSAQQKIDILILGVRDIKVSNIQDPSAYEYYLYVSIDKKRKVAIKESVPLIDQRLNFDLQVPIRLNRDQERISLILTRKTSQTSREQFLCFNYDIPYNPNQKLAQDTLLKPQGGKFKIFMNYRIQQGIPGCVQTIDNFSHNLVPGQIVGFRSKETNKYECGMVIGIEQQGSQIVVQPSQADKFTLQSKQHWQDKYNSLLIDNRQIEQLEGRYHIPTYWLDKHLQSTSNSVLNKDLGGRVVHEWLLGFEFTFPIQLTMVLNQIQRRFKEFKFEQYINFVKNLQKFQSIGGGGRVILPKMGTIQIEILNCSNLQQYKHGDKYKIKGDVESENPDYAYNDDIQQESYVKVKEIMKKWKLGQNERPQTDQGEAVKQTVNDKYMLSWNKSQYG